MTLLEKLDLFGQVSRLIPQDQTRCPGPLGRFLQFGSDEGMVGLLHRHQGDQVQVGQSQGTLSDGNCGQGTAHDDEEFFRADLDGVIDDPQPRTIRGQGA